MVTDWRLPVPADVMEDVFWASAGPLIVDDEPSAMLLAGMMVCAADGMLVNVPDTPANRAAFGCTGTAEQDGDGSAPFPQARVVALTARACRAKLGAICGRARAGEQTLLKRLVRRRPDLVAGRVICFGRNFRGYDLIMVIPEAGGHVIARVKEGIPLVTADEESFTAVRHHVIRSMTSTQVTASSSLEQLAAAADAAARAALHTLNLPGRQRHSRRAQKARPKLAHTSATKTTVTGNPRSPCSPPAFTSPWPERNPPGRRNPRASGTADRGTARCPPRHADRSHAHEPAPP